MNRRGFALLLVLWLIVLLGGLVAVTLSGGRLGSATVRNRLALARAGWAREGCLEILLGRAERDTAGGQLGALASLDSVDLGRGVWCTLRLDDPGSRIQVNTAPVAGLTAVFQDSALARAIVTGRPWPAPEALGSLLQAHRAEWSLPLLTTRGTGRINLSAAPAPVLSAIPGVSREGARAIVMLRPTRGYSSLDGMLAQLPATVRAALTTRYDAFAALAEVEPEMLVATSVGHARDGPPATLIATLVPAGRRVAVVQREAD